MRVSAGLCNPRPGNAGGERSVIIDVRGIGGISEQRLIENHKIYRDGRWCDATDPGDLLDEEIRHDLSASAIIPDSEDGVRIPHPASLGPFPRSLRG